MCIYPVLLRSNFVNTHLSFFQQCSTFQAIILLDHCQIIVLCYPLARAEKIPFLAHQGLELPLIQVMNQFNKA